MDFRFTNDYPPSRIDEIVSYLLGPRLWIPSTDYPDFLDWAEKAHAELRTETKRAMIAVSQGELVGATIYQRHKKFPYALEIKNLTVRPDVQGRHVASFLLRNTEIEGGTEFRSTHILCDAKANNFAIRMFLFNNRYTIVGKDTLYAWNTTEDIIYSKKLLPRLVV